MQDSVARSRRIRGAALLRLSVFAGLPLLSAASPILVIPSLTAVLGARGWGAIAVGQSVGTFGALLVSFGWSIEGPSRAAASDHGERRILYGESMASRLLTSVLTLPLTVVVAFLVPTPDRPAASLMALAAAASGLLPTWFFIGTGQPIRLALFDTIPRVLAAIVAVVLLPLVRQGWVYPTVLLSTICIAAGVSSKLLTGAFFKRPNLGHLQQLRASGLLVLSSLISSGYGSLSLTFVAAASPLAAVDYAAGTRVLALATSFAGSISNALQGWVSSARHPEGELYRRRGLALSGSVVGGGLAASVLFISFPLVSSFLFSGRVSLSATEKACVAICLWLIVIGMSASFHVLIPSRKTRAVALSGIATTIVGVPTLIIGSHLGRAEGALIGLTMTETLSTTIQILACITVFRGRLNLGKSRAATSG